MTFDGRWRITIVTPIGKQEAILEISTVDGVVRGTARQGAETVAMLDPLICDDRLTWSQRITKPLRLLLHFDVTGDGERLRGTAKAGALPASTLTGERIRQEEGTERNGPLEPAARSGTAGAQ